MPTPLLDTSIYLNGTRLPNYNDFSRDYKVNQTVNETQGGSIYADYLNIRRVWVAKWDKLFREQYELIYSFFLYQYTYHTFPILYVPAYNISKPVMLDISKQDIKHNGVIIENFSLFITEQEAFS